MRYKLLDGKVMFPIYYLRIKNEDMNNVFLSRFEFVDNDIIIYDSINYNYIIKQLEKLNIDYDVIKVDVDEHIVEKTKDIKYINDIEVDEHLFKNKEPESQKLPNIIKRLEKNEKDMKETKLELAEAKLELKKAKDDIVKLNNKKSI